MLFLLLFGDFVGYRKMPSVHEIFVDELCVEELARSLRQLRLVLQLVEDVLLLVWRQL